MILRSHKSPPSSPSQPLIHDDSEYDKQLFRKIPTYETMRNILEAFGSVSKTTGDILPEYSFTKRDMRIQQTCAKLTELRSELEEYYHVSKAHVYLDCITESKAITILRHFIRPFHFYLLSKERYSSGVKYTCYTLCQRRPIVTNTNVVVKIGG